MLVLLVLQVLIVNTFGFVYTSNDGVRERCFLSCHEHGTKKKFLVHIIELQTFAFRALSNALPLSHKDSMVSVQGQNKVNL